MVALAGCGSNSPDAVPSTVTMPSPVPVQLSGVATDDDGTPVSGVTVFVYPSGHYPSGNAVTTVTLTDNRISGDVLTASYTGAAFADKNAGTAKPVNVSGISLSGVDAGNYTCNSTASTALTERLRIISTGNVGIGVTAPVAKLNILISRPIALAASFEIRCLEPPALGKSPPGCKVGRLSMLIHTEHVVKVDDGPYARTGRVHARRVRPIAPRSRLRRRRHL